MTIVADNHSNALIINTTPEDYPAVESLIKKLDVPQKQVALEVLIVQVSGTKVKELGAQILAKNCNKTMEQIMADFDRDYWMNAKEAVEYGIVDKIAKSL